MPISLKIITSGYTFENAVAPLLQKYVHSTHPVLTSNTDTDDLSIYMGLKYRSMRHVTLGVTMMIHLVLTLIMGV